MNSADNNCNNVEEFFDQMVKRMKLDFTRNGISEGAFSNAEVQRMETIFAVSMDCAKKKFSELLKQENVP